MLKMLVSQIVLALLFVPGISWSQQEFAKKEPKPYGNSFSVYLDNDSRNIGGPNADQGYTNGLRFAYGYATDDIPSWVKLLPWSSRIQKKFENATSNYGISLAQQIYTPNDTEETALISNDRPYAGYLYLGATAAYKTTSHQHIFEFNFGLVGPGARGESIQNGFHQLIDVPKARGWENQLNNEPTLQLSYTQKIRFIQFEDSLRHRYFDLIPEAGAQLGNVQIGGHAGFMLRFGYHLPDDFGASSFNNVGGDSMEDLLNESSRWRIYGFFGLRGKYIARNIFIDGNTFQPSHHVTRYPFVAENEIGYAIQYANWMYSWRFVTLSPEFEQFSEADSYASVSLTYLKKF